MTWLPPVAIIASFAALFVVVLFVMPGLAYDRMLRDLADARISLRKLVATSPELQKNADVEDLAEFIAFWARLPRAVGLSHWIESFVLVWQAGFPATPPRFRGLHRDTQHALGDIETATAKALARGTLFGSRLWFILWPTFALARYVILPLLFRSLRRQNASARQPERVTVVSNVDEAVTVTSWTLSDRHREGDFGHERAGHRGRRLLGAH